MENFEHHTESYQDVIMTTRPETVPAATLWTMLQDARRALDELEAEHEAELEAREAEIDQLENERDELRERLDELMGRVRVEYQIAGEYLPSLINGDDSGLSGTDTAVLEAFLEKEKIHDSGLFTTENDDEGQYCRCDVSGLYANCYTVYWMREH